MISPPTCVAVLWLTWLAGWWIGALSTARTVALQAIAARLAHAVLLAGGAVLIFFKPPGFPGLTSRFLPASGWIPWAGVITTALGLSWSVWARIHLGRLWSATVTIKSGHTIVRTGPYALTRHPIYTGLLFALIGSTMVNGTIAGLAGLMLVALGLVVKIRQEEHLLIEHFGDAYRAYQAEVPALIPGIRDAKRQ